MKRSLKIAIGVLVTFLISLFLVSPASAEVIRMDTDGPCPISHPIKHQITDAQTGVTYFNCMTQYQWDIEMIGGDTHAKWLASGEAYDATQDIANWKAELAAIEKLRADTEALAKAEAIKNPNTQICKAYNYTSTYNGSGGGSFCTIHTETVDVSVKPVEPVEPEQSALIQMSTASALQVLDTQTKYSVIVKDVPAVTSVTAKYFSNTTKAVKKLKKMKYTFPKGPKSTVIAVSKIAGDSCFVSGRTVYLGKNSECTVSVSISKKGVLQGTKTLSFVR